MNPIPLTSISLLGLKSATVREMLEGSDCKTSSEIRLLPHILPTHTQRVGASYHYPGSRAPSQRYG
jgi:hypothetical protein